MNHLNPAPILTRLHQLHDAMRDGLHRAVCAAANEGRLEGISAATAVQGGDTIYALDRRGDEILLPFCEEWGRETPFLLIAEGLETGQRLFGCRERNDAEFIFICDPIDGTRPLMYDKRSAWLLCGVAPNVADPKLSDIEIALQGELPTSRARVADRLWAVRGGGAQAETTDLATGESRRFVPRPSGAETVAGGFAMFSKFFIGSKGWLANLEEELIEGVLGAPPDGQPHTFDDQYISSGGQLYELMTGHDRFNADLRPLAHAKLHGGSSTRLCAHPYDLCTELIARECGVIVTDETGAPLEPPLDVTSPVSWMGYANPAIRAEIEATLLDLLERNDTERRLSILADKGQDLGSDAAIGTSSLNLAGERGDVYGYREREDEQL